MLRLNDEPVWAAIMTDQDRAEITGLLRGACGLTLPQYARRLDSELRSLCSQWARMRSELQAAGVSLPPEAAPWNVASELIAEYERLHSGACAPTCGGADWAGHCRVRRSGH